MTKRISYKDVYNYFESQGCRLLSKEYKNNKQKLKYVCICGNDKEEISFDKFKNRNQRCSICAKKSREESRRRFFYDDIKNHFEKNGAKLLTKKSEYKNVNQLLDYICSCGSPHKIDYMRYKNNVRCPVCAGNNIKPFDEVKEVIESQGYTLLSEDWEYKNGSSILTMLCKEGHLVRKPFNVFKSNVVSKNGNCYECRNIKISKHNRFSYEFVKEYFEENGCVLLSKEYNESTFQHLEYICVCGNKSVITFNQFKNKGNRCQECRKNKLSEMLSGENHYNYNPLLTDKERNEKRLSKKYREWRKTVLYRDENTCKCCGSKEKSLNVHHKNSWNLYPEDRYDVENGVTLCVDCHHMFHHLYGYGFNTKEQFEDFIIEFNKIKGVYS